MRKRNVRSRSTNAMKRDRQRLRQSTGPILYIRHQSAKEGDKETDDDGTEPKDGSEDPKEFRSILEPGDLTKDLDHGNKDAGGTHTGNGATDDEGVDVGCEGASATGGGSVSGRGTSLRHTPENRVQRERWRPGGCTWRRRSGAVDRTRAESRSG